MALIGGPIGSHHLTPHLCSLVEVARKTATRRGKCVSHCDDSDVNVRMTLPSCIMSSRSSFMFSSLALTRSAAATSWLAGYSAHAGQAILLKDLRDLSFRRLYTSLVMYRFNTDILFAKRNM